MDIIDGLCEICRQTPKDWDKLVHGCELPHHNSVLELRRSAQKGCTLCAICMSDAICSGYVIDTKVSEMDEGVWETDEEDVREVESLDTQSSSNIESENSNHDVYGLSSDIYTDDSVPGNLCWGIGFENGGVFSLIEFSPVPHSGA